VSRPRESGPSVKARTVPFSGRDIATNLAFSKSDSCGTV
jgi:hypothetical protein